MENTTVETLNWILGTGGVFLLLASVLLYGDIFFNNRQQFRAILERWGLTIAAASAISALLMALVYSEYFGFVPCGLCWSMRIFVFSQAFIMPVAAYLKDTRIALYGIILSVPGVFVGLYQHYLQMGGNELIGCPTAGAGADCSKVILFEYGFMTFPLMGAAMLVFLIAVYWYVYKTGSEQPQTI